MKWIFSKENDQCNIIIQKTDGTKIDFSYIDMIKELYEERKIEDAEFKGNFTKEEQESVIELVNEINNHTCNFFEQEGEKSKDD